MTLSVIDTQSESFLSQNITTFPDTPRGKEGGGGTMTRGGGNKETTSSSHFLPISKNHNIETQNRNNNNRQKSGKTVNNKQTTNFDTTQFRGKWLSNITDSIYLSNSILSQQIFDSDSSPNEAIPFFPASDRNDELVGSVVPAAKLINSQTSRRSEQLPHDNNDDEVNAFIAQKQKLAKVIFFSFATLHEFLTDADQNLSQGSSTNPQNADENTNYEKGNRKYQNLALNSRIISASIDEKSLRRRTNKKYFYDTSSGDNDSSYPPVVSIQFSHIHEQMSDPICVFWNNEEEAWSNDGCHVVKSHKRMTTCECKHLTHFALLMKFPDHMDIKSIGSGIIFNSDVYSQRNEDSSTSTVITLEIATYIISTVCLIILILLLIQVNQFFHLNSVRSTIKNIHGIKIYQIDNNT